MLALPSWSTCSLNFFPFVKLQYGYVVIRFDDVAIDAGALTPMAAKSPPSPAAAQMKARVCRV